MFSDNPPQENREWPNVPFPTISASDVPPTIPDAPVRSDQSERSELPERSEATQNMVAIHHAAAKYCEQLGIDACKEYKQNKAENILIGLTREDKTCKLCQKSYAATSQLRNHLKKKHLGKTDYK